MILLIDNYDSFVHNLARYVGRLNRARQVVRNDKIDLAGIENLAPEAIILSPGPCTPKESGICLPLIEKFHRTIPILGICLGHQAIGEAFGGQVVRAARPVHGKASPIAHDNSPLFHGIPQPFTAGRYHSLAVALPADNPLRITAHALDDDTIMSLSHPDYPTHGLQFHPESILTDQGLTLLQNFLTLADNWNAQKREAA